MNKPLQRVVLVVDPDPGAAAAVGPALRREGYQVRIIDGDTVRDKHHKNLGFSREGIAINNRKIMNLCAQERSRSDVILIPVIAQNNSVLRWFTLPVPAEP